MPRNSLSVPVAQKLQLSGQSGVSAELDLSRIKATPEQKRTLQKLLVSGDLATLSATERNLIKDLKARIRPGASPALIVRFDWKWVRIDEPQVDLPEVKKRGTKKKR